jgi:uncharacterized protein YndB with AHSA1/START domain
MTDRHVQHGTFSLEPHYPAAPDRVFAAWAEPAAKARWFAGPEAEHRLDFRVGGRETVRRAAGDGHPALAFESVYHDIVPGERIVYTSTLTAGDELSTVSLTTVEFQAVTEGTRLLLVEQDAFLDGQEEPGWREEGTRQWLAALAAELGEGSRS